MQKQPRAFSMPVDGKVEALAPKWQQTTLLAGKLVLRHRVREQSSGA